jgi:hypothetical protein
VCEDGVWLVPCIFRSSVLRKTITFSARPVAPPSDLSSNVSALNGSRFLSAISLETICF